MPDVTPAFYDDAGIVIRVDPDQMFYAATVEMKTCGEQVAGQINAIVNIWNGLKLGWIGGTAEEVQDFNERWAASITQLFGTEEDPSTGVLSKIGTAVATAALNFGQTEDIVMNMFMQVTMGLQNSSSGEPSSRNGDWSSRNVTDGPITEQT